MMYCQCKEVIEERLRSYACMTPIAERATGAGLKLAWKFDSSAAKPDCLIKMSYP